MDDHTQTNHPILVVAVIGVVVLALAIVGLSGYLTAHDKALPGELIALPAVVVAGVLGLLAPSPLRNQLPGGPLGGAPRSAEPADGPLTTPDRPRLRR